jgi:ubiquinone/menaquinone biosynthesis C-methylase UbiE
MEMDKLGDYDHFAKTYDEAIRRKTPIIERSYRFILDQLGAVDDEKRICDLGCGQGELSRRLAEKGAKVTGIDYSKQLLLLAQEYLGSEKVEWIRDDAQRLSKVKSEKFDFVVSNLMLMDVADHEAVFQSAHRILVEKGLMVWVIMHPCFQSPHSETLDDGARKIMNYTAQWWKSAGVGTLRGTLGAHHRPIEQYINTFLAAGFQLKGIKELTVSKEVTLGDKEISHYEIPPLFACIGEKG